MKGAGGAGASDWVYVSARTAPYRTALILFPSSTLPTLPQFLHEFLGSQHYVHSGYSADTSTTSTTVASNTRALTTYDTGNELLKAVPGLTTVLDSLGIDVPENMDVVIEGGGGCAHVDWDGVIGVEGCGEFSHGLALTINATDSSSSVLLASKADLWAGYTDENRDTYELVLTEFQAESEGLEVSHLRAPPAPLPR